MARTRKKSRKSAGGAATAEALLSVPVAYGNLSVGKDTVNLTLSVERRFLTLSAADRHLTGKRLTGRITAVPGNDNPEQQQLPGLDAEEAVSGAFDVRSFRATRRTISFGVTFSRADTDVEVLAHFAQGSGTFSVFEVAELPKSEKAQAAAGDDGAEAGEE